MPNQRICAKKGMYPESVNSNTPMELILKDRNELNQKIDR